MPDTHNLPEDHTGISETTLRTMIAGLRREDEVFAGRKFFECLLDQEGVDGVMGFIRRASAALDRQDDLSVQLNFTPAERRIFNMTYLNLFSKREFLSTVGWGVPGAVFVAYGAAGSVEAAEKLASGKKIAADPKKSAAGHVKETLEEYVYPPAEVLIGAALVHESFEEWTDIKLEQISDAMELLARRMREEMPKSAGRSA